MEVALLLPMQWKLPATALFASAIAVSSTRAQDRNSAILVGSVRDTAGQAVGLAQVAFQGLLAISDSAGRFALRGLPPGAGTLQVRRMGFEPRTLTVRLNEGRTDSLLIVLALLPTQLDDVTAEGRAVTVDKLRDFHRHRENGVGRFYDRKEIEAKRLRRLSDLLRQVPGVRLIPDRTGRYQLRMGRSTGPRDCPPDFWIDGVRAVGLNVDDVPLVDIEALEVYNGVTGLPPEYINRFGTPNCGSVIIWTRKPG